MIKSLKALFAKPVAQDAAVVEHQLQLAAAALLVEMSRADYVVGDAERQTMTHVLHTALGISTSEIEQLINLAHTSADRATSLYEFTSLINDHYSKQQKLALILSMWRVAYADDDLNKYEERLIRQVSDLIHVSHSDFMRMKLEVATPTSPAQAQP
jgi:uncharacterized tellurite resistance protein B-like protein